MFSTTDDSPRAVKMMKKNRIREVYFGFTCSLCLIAAMTNHASADVLFYNGDNGPVGNAFLNQLDFNSPDVTQYTEFRVPSGFVWQVSGVFAITAYNLDNGAPQNSPPNTQAYFEIRSNVSAGNGGILIDSGTASALPVATGYSNGGYDRFRIEADFSPFNLSAGAYWMSIVPIGNHDGYAFVDNTLGANGVNVFAGQQSFYSVGGGVQFGTTPTNESEGVVGTSANAVPEPTTLAMFAGIGAVATMGAAVGRLRRRATMAARS
jgi:hypothetical protein